MRKKDGPSPRTHRIALLGILAAQALALSFLENLLPAIPGLPPGAKPGLANIVTMFAAFTMDAPAVFGIVVLKALFAGATRGATALTMSLCGGLLSAAALLAMARLPKNPFGILGVSILSAVAHNAGQLAAAAVLTGTSALLAYAPALMLFAIVTGLITGAVLKAVLPVLLRQSRFFMK